jgi:hypothetical protein
MFLVSNAKLESSIGDDRKNFAWQLWVFKGVSNFARYEKPILHLQPQEEPLIKEILSKKITLLLPFFSVFGLLIVARIPAYNI